jgi:Zn finger protein HypA/HybF involved in hydrogenase expression
MEETRHWKCQKCGWYGKSRETVVTYSGNMKGRLCPRCHTKVIHVVGKENVVEQPILTGESI